MNEWRQRGCQMKTVYHKEVGRGVACGTTRVGCSTVSEMSLEGRSATYTKDDAPEVLSFAGLAGGADKNEPGEDVQGVGETTHPWELLESFRDTETCSAKMHDTEMSFVDVQLKRIIWKTHRRIQLRCVIWRWAYTAKARTMRDTETSSHTANRVQLRCLETC